MTHSEAVQIRCRQLCGEKFEDDLVSEAIRVIQNTRTYTPHVKLKKTKKSWGGKDGKVASAPPLPEPPAAPPPAPALQPWGRPQDGMDIARATVDAWTRIGGD